MGFLGAALFLLVLATVQVSSQNESDYCRFYEWENGIHAHPSNCTKFVQCSFFQTYVLSCPAGLGYDPDLKTCIYMNQVTACYHLPPVTTPPPQDDDNVGITNDTCENYRLANGIYPDPGDCHKFIQCFQSQTFSFVCPSGLNYNPAKKYCDNEHGVDCLRNYRFFN